MSHLTKMIDETLEAWETGRGFDHVEDTIYLLRRYRKLILFFDKYYRSSCEKINRIERMIFER